MAVAVITAMISGCASDNGYQQAFSAGTSSIGNQHTFKAPYDQTFSAVKMTLVRKGFLIDQADVGSGLIKAKSSYKDNSDENVSYNIIATADVTADADSSVVTLAASQQTVLHRKDTSGGTCSGFFQYSLS